MKALRQKKQQSSGKVRRIALWPDMEVYPVVPTITQPLPKIAFHVQNAVEFVDPLTVTHLEAQSNYTEVHFTNGRRLLVSRTLKSCSAVFPKSFLRIHQSFLVNPQCIQTYLRHEHALRLDNGVLLPASRSGKTVMHEFIRIV